MSGARDSRVGRFQPHQRVGGPVRDQAVEFGRSAEGQRKRTSFSCYKAENPAVSVQVLKGGVRRRDASEWSIEY